MKRMILPLVVAGFIVVSLIQEGKAGNYCTGKSNGHYPDPDNCHGYISCVHAIVYHRPCPANLVWSDSIKRCEWPGKEKPPCRPRCRNKLSKKSCNYLKRLGECKKSAYISKLCCGSCNFKG